MDAVLVILLGVAAGAVAGLFGVGGGIVFVPTLTLVLGLTQLEAEATSLLAIIPVALLGSWRQTRAGQVRWRDATIIGLLSVGTAVAGAASATVKPRRTPVESGLSRASGAPIDTVRVSPSYAELRNRHHFVLHRGKRKQQGWYHGRTRAIRPDAHPNRGSS